MIDLKEISFAYPRGPRVLKDVSFRIERGGCVCLLGPNGTGKTTLIKCLLGFQKPASGSILIDGRNLGDFTARERASHIAYVSQSSDIAFPYTVSEVIEMGRISHMRLGASLSEKDEAAVGHAMERLEITGMKDRFFQTLSGGERQMVLFARALAQEADYLILDEPTAALDYSNQIRILRMIHSLRDSGLGILMTTHFPDHAFLTGTKAVLMRDGVVMEEGDPRTVVTGENLTKLYKTTVCVADTDLTDHGTKRKQRVCVPLLETSDGPYDQPHDAVRNTKA